MINRTGTVIKWSGKTYQPGEDVPEDTATEMGLASMDAQKQGIEAVRRENRRGMQRQERLNGRPVVIVGDPNRQSEQEETQEGAATQTRKRKPRA